MLNFLRTATSQARYSRLAGGSGNDGKPDQRNVFWGWIALAVLVSVLSFLMGRGFRPSNPDVIYLPSTSEVFKYNISFSDRPSKITDQAWKELMPEQGGYFRHPQISPKRATFSVFHQLHCIDGIRHGYWMIYEAAIAGRKMKEDEIPFMASPSHIRHCLDLLRQSLKCRPDLTVEVKDEEKGGVTGFGTEHQCKDWDTLVRWVSEWETYGQSPNPPS